MSKNSSEATKKSRMDVLRMARVNCIIISRKEDRIPCYVVLFFI